MARAPKQKSTGSNRTGLEKSAGKSNGNSTSDAQLYPYFAMCIDGKGWEGSLMLGKIYQVLQPDEGAKSSWIRVIDDEGEDYLYPSTAFVPVDLPSKAKQALVAAQTL